MPHIALRFYNTYFNYLPLAQCSYGSEGLWLSWRIHKTYECDGTCDCRCVCGASYLLRSHYYRFILQFQFALKLTSGKVHTSQTLTCIHGCCLKTCKHHQCQHQTHFILWAADMLAYNIPNIMFMIGFFQKQTCLLQTQITALISKELLQFAVIFDWYFNTYLPDTGHF
jgi:hypothetical protein